MLLTTDYMIVLRETGEGSGSEERKEGREGGRESREQSNKFTPHSVFMYLQEILTLIACPVIMLWEHNVFLN